jgi:ubiquinone/menaquinone biosynthesis C-methylase UbiE
MKADRMSQKALKAHYQPNWRLANRLKFQAYNCGYLRDEAETFATHQQNLVWQVLGDTGISSDSTVLDVGCGIGGPAHWIRERYQTKRVMGLEYCGETVQNARQLWRDESASGRLQWIQADAHHLPLASASVDCILNLESALHYRDKAGFLRECQRVLKPGGALCLGDITTRGSRALSMLATATGAAVRLWTVEEYRRAFETLGYEILQYEDASVPVSQSLRTGLAESARLTFRERSGVRGRIWFLAVLERLLRRGTLGYDLFVARPCGEYRS